LRERIAHLIVPKRKVIDLHSADTDQNPKDFEAASVVSSK